MSSNTTNLNLYKADPVADANNTFNIKTMLNDNWDKIDTAIIAKLLEAKGYTDTKIQQLINSAPGALDTLKELADALGDDANFSATMTNALALKAPLASPTLTGTPSAPTPAADTNTTQIATTAFVLGQAGTTAPQMDGAGAAGTSNKYARADHVHPNDTTKANVASPTLTGTPSAPTPAADTNTTQIATTAFVLGQAGTIAPQMDGAGATGTSNKYARADHVHPSDATKANVASPTFTGTPTAPTPAAGTNTTQIATTAFVSTAVANLVSSAPSTLDTLNELATALGDDPKFATTMTNTLATKAPLASPTFTGTPAAPTPAADTNTTQIATTAFVLGQAGATTPNMDGAATTGTSNKYARADHVHPSDATKANVASPTFTGTVKTTNNTLDDGSGNMIAAGTLTSKAKIAVNNQGTTTLNSYLLGNPTANYYLSGSAVGDTILINETNTNILFGFAGASGTENPALKISYNATDASKVSTQRNTLDDGSGNIVMSNGIGGGSQTNFHVYPSSGGSVGLTNNARNKWGVRVNDNASGNPQAYTCNNTLDDGNGGMTVGGLTVNSNAQINGSLYFKANMDNSDTITLSKNNVASNVSSLDITVGDDGLGAAITAPSSGSTDYVSIKSTNVGIHHLFGSDGTYKAATNVSAPTLTSTAGTGIAPLTVASTTKVNNLNADLLDGYDSDSFVQKYGYQTSNSGATYVGKYTKIASITITSQYGNCGATLALRNDGTGDYTDGTGFLQLRVKQQNALGSAPYVSLRLFGNTNVLTIANFFAVTTVNTTNATTVEFYYKESIYNDYLIFTPIVQSGSVSFYSNQAYLSALPSGTVTSCAQMGWNGDLNASGKLTTSNNTLDDGAGNMTVAGTLTAPSIKLTGDIINDGNERHFRANGTNVNWGYYVNNNGFGGYDWTNSRGVFSYSSSANQLAIQAGKITTNNNTLDDGSGNMVAKGALTVNTSLFINGSSDAAIAIGGSNNSNVAMGQYPGWDNKLHINQYSNAGVKTTARSAGVEVGGDLFLENGSVVCTNTNNELEFRKDNANAKMGVFVNDSGMGFHDWKNNKNVMTYIPSTNNLNILGNGGTVTITGNTVCHLGNESASHGSTGYKKFADGVIIQWGSIGSGANTNQNFPMAFPNNCYVFNISANNSATVSPSASGYPISTSQFNTYVPTGLSASWIAIGN